MSATAAPFGIRPLYSPNGVVRPGPSGPSLQIASGLATAIFQNHPIQILASGFVSPAAAGARALGSFQGVEFVDATGKPNWMNQWPAAQTLFANTIARVYATTNQPGLVYEVQGNAAVAISLMGAQADWTALAGSTVTGLSSVALDVASAAANAGLRVIGLVPYVDNDWNDAFTIVQVQYSEHQYTADIAAV
jgi:hypothetical protein